VQGPPRKGLLIVGSTSWSLSLADQLRQLDVPVMIVDTSWPRLSLARQAGIATYHGEILAEATEERLELGQFQVLVATTDSEAYNALVCSEFAPEFGRDAVYQLGGSGDDEDHRSLPEALRGRAMFASGAGVAEILERERLGWTFRKTRLSDQFDFADAQAALPDQSDMLFVLRKDGRIVFFTHASRPTPQAGDTIISYGPRATRNPKPRVALSGTGMSKGGDVVRRASIIAFSVLLATLGGCNRPGPDKPGQDASAQASDQADDGQGEGEGGASSAAGQSASGEPAPEPKSRSSAPRSMPGRRRPRCCCRCISSCPGRPRLSGSTMPAGR
jgi:hypothetical protein